MRAHHPACLRGAGGRRGSGAEENRGYAVTRGGESEPPAQRKIDEFRFPKRFENHRAQSGAGKTLSRRPQGILQKGDVKEEHPGRIQG